MSSQVEQLSALERRVSFAIPVAAVETETDARLRKMARSVKMAGFRPGKVPLKMVAQTYGPQVRYEVIGEHVNRAFGEAVGTHQLRVAGQPRIEPNPDAQDASHFSFTATFEIMPEIAFPPLSGITIERPAVEITEEDVDRTIETLRKQRIRYETKSGPSAEGDRMIVDFHGEIDGVPFQGGSAKDFALVVGDRRMLPEFETNATGMAAGEQKEFDVAFPEDYFGRDVAGKTAHFRLTVKDVARGILPEVDAEFARAFGIASGDIAMLRQEVRANLELERKRRVFAVERNEVFKALRAAVDVQTPRSLVQAEASRMAEAASNDLKQRGVKAEHAQVSPTTFEPAAAERVTMGLIVGELVRSRNLEATPAQVRALVEEHAQSYEHPEQVIAWHFQDPRRLASFEALALERNVVAHVLSEGKVVDKPMAFADLVGQSAE